MEGSVEYDESISDLKFKIRSKLNKFKSAHTVPDQSANVPNLSENKNSSTSINLPKISIPTFSGDSSTFLEFFNSFSSAIDADESLSNVEKFIYLKSFISGEAFKNCSRFFPHGRKLLILSEFAEREIWKTRTLDKLFCK